MTPWRTGKGGVREFTLGKIAWAEAARIAAECHYFAEDVEEEVQSDVARSCYGCRYRRWTSDSFECLAPVRRT